LRLKPQQMNKLRGLLSASELYRLSDRHFLANCSADKGCRVVSIADPPSLLNIIRVLDKFCALNVTKINHEEWGLLGCYAVWLL
jgi:hypothetical protein